LSAKAIEVREIDQETAGIVPELLYKIFGYTYGEPWLYSPDEVMRALAEGRSHFMAGFDGSGVARGLVGLQRQFPSPDVAMLGQLVIDPVVEQADGGQYLRLLMDAAHDKAWDLALTTNLKALVIQEVTEHQLTQRLGKIMKFKTTGILLGVTPAWVERLRKPPVDRVAFRRGALLRPEEDTHRLSEVVSVRPIPRTFKAPFEVSLPDRYANLLADIYESLKATVEFVGPRPLAQMTSIDCQYNYHKSIARVEILEVGEDAPDLLSTRLDHYRAGLAHVIQFVLPLGKGDINPAVERLVEEGCKYGALLPSYRSCDVLIMQLALKPTLELSDKDLFNPMARRILREVS